MRKKMLYERTALRKKKPVHQAFSARPVTRKSDDLVQMAIHGILDFFFSFACALSLSISL
jgi:hypothetical protein